jgi:NAD(P)-dependent dehydrogenase (short-subunit alcohol dehydrogenase family)
VKLTNRNILVTGAASGIGLEVIKLFADEGARLAIAAREQSDAEQARALCRHPERHVAVSGDLTDADAVAALTDRAVATLGKIDGLVHSAGVDHIAPFAETSNADFQRVLNQNLTSAFLICQATAPHIEAAGGGTMVTMASGAALLPLAGRTAYCAAKAGLVMFSKTLALELASAKIRVNALCPGAIDTPMLRASAGGEFGDPVPTEVVSRFAMGRIGLPDEIARATLFLSSEDSSFVTGAALTADGGRTFH